MTREPIYSALFALVSAMPGLQTASRRLVHWSDVAPANQPALYMAQTGEVAQTTVRGAPIRWTLSVDLYLYVNVGNDPNATPASILNPLLDALMAALMPSPGQVQTLGGRVSQCWIAGKIETDEGVLGPQSVAVIPIEILTV